MGMYRSISREHLKRAVVRMQTNRRALPLCHSTNNFDIGVPKTKSFGEKAQGIVLITLADETVGGTKIMRHPLAGAQRRDDDKKRDRGPFKVVVDADVFSKRRRQ